VAGADDMLSMQVDQLLDALAADSGPPAGASAAAIIVAMAAGVIQMTALVSRSRWDEAGETAARAEALRARVAPLAQADSDAYTEAMAAIRASRSAAPEDRDRAIGEALARAADTPLRIALAAAEVAELAAMTAEACGPDLRADAVAAALYADAAARATARMVEVNLARTAGDPRMAEARGAAERAGVASRRAQELEH
jgi:formiminotetrahydrofolate cyclodeaminase